MRGASWCLLCWLRWDSTASDGLDRWETIFPQQAVEGSDSFPSVRYSHGAVADAARQRMVVTHGYFYNHERRLTAFQSDTWAFSFVTHKWTRLADSGGTHRPSARYSASLEAWGDAAYLFGGTAEEGESYNDLWRFDLTSDTWTAVVLNEPASRPSPRSLHGSIVLADRMYVYGGLDKGDMWYFDFKENGWHEVPQGATAPGGQSPHPGLRWGMSLASIGSEGFYLFGGVKRTGQGYRAADFNDLWYFSAASDGIWKELLPAPERPAGMAWPSPRRYASVALHPNGHAFVVFGGAHCEPGCKCQGDLWKFDLPTRSWELQKVGKQPTPRYRQSLVKFGGALYLFGGESYSPYMYHNSVMRVALETPSAEEL